MCHSKNQLKIQYPADNNSPKFFKMYLTVGYHVLLHKKIISAKHF